MKIQVLSVQVQTVPTKSGSYQVADVAFKNLTFQGKVEGKKVMSFGATKDAFTTLATAQPNDIFEVNVVKNDKGYNDWVSMTKGDANTPTQQAPTGQSATGNGTARTSTYETPEERAKKQVYIVRQSSLSNAIDSLSVGGKSALKPDEVIDLARKYEAYVFGSAAIPAPESFPDESFPDMPQ